MWLFWVSLAFLLTAVVVSLTVTTRRALRLFRDVKQLTAATGKALDEVSRSAEQVERHLELAAASGTRLDASLARLRVSRARLNVQRAAIDDVRAAIARVTGLRPRK